jgi:hypothetical protein
MHGKIGLEEHFAIADTLMDSAGFVPDDHWAELRASRISTILAKSASERVSRSIL